MRYWMDTEFIEYPCTIDLISIGIVAENGKEFYAESTEVDWDKASDWVIQNVRPYLVESGAVVPLRIDPVGSVHVFATKAEIATSILAFIGNDPFPELWGWYCDYDWVVFAWLFGTMSDLPHHFPHHCLDLKQWEREMNKPYLPPQKGTKHNALEDARWTKQAWEQLHEMREMIAARNFKNALSTLAHQDGL